MVINESCVGKGRGGGGEGEEEAATRGSRVQNPPDDDGTLYDPSQME